MTCPTPSKRRFVGRLEALREAAVLTHDLRRGPFEVYECVCGAWHLTRQRLRIPPPPKVRRR